MKRILQVIKYLLFTILGLLLLLTVLGLIHSIANPGMKSISLTDLTQLGIAITINIVLLAVTIKGLKSIK